MFGVEPRAVPAVFRGRQILAYFLSPFESRLKPR
jgi:hypothetical protein